MKFTGNFFLLQPSSLPLGLQSVTLKQLAKQQCSFAVNHKGEHRCLSLELRNSIFFFFNEFDCTRSQLRHSGSLLAACMIFTYGMKTLSCGMWDLVPWPKIEPRPPALGIWSLSHWTRKVQKCHVLITGALALLLSVTQNICYRNMLPLLEVPCSLPGVNTYFSNLMEVITLSRKPSLISLMRSNYSNRFCQLLCCIVTVTSLHFLL